MIRYYYMGLSFFYYLKHRLNLLNYINCGKFNEPIEIIILLCYINSCRHLWLLYTYCLKEIFT